jgi:hypothetical protein
MKTSFLQFLAALMIVSLYAISTPAQEEPDKDLIWSKINIDPDYIIGPVEEISYTPRKHPINVKLSGVDAEIGPNFRPLPSTNRTQSEMSVDVHPSNHQIVFGSANGTNWPVTTIYGTGVYWTFDGGGTWTGYDDPLPVFPRNSGDPVSIIGNNGYMYEGYISSSSGQGISVSTNGGANWSTYTVAPNPGTLADKNHLMIDKKVGSPYENRLYAAWTDFGGSNNYRVVVRYSTNFGQTWSSPSTNISNALGGYLHQGVNIQTGPNGEVYAVFAVYIDGSVATGEDGIGFAKSTNGGVTWSAPMYAYQATNFGIRGTLSSKAGIRVSSFPSMTVDRTGGPNNGYIYVTWPQRGVSPAGNDPDIVMIRSTDGGTTWSAPLRVNDDPINNNRDQYYPWMTVDQSTGDLHFVWYDSRLTTNDSASVFMARSVDGGLTFENYKVSDQNFKPKPISGLSGGYQGDYIGIAALNNHIYPFWCDDRTGNYQGWMSVVQLSAPCPVEAASNPNPPTGTSNVPISLAQVSWTNGPDALTNELYFGTNPGSLTLVQSGTLATSWNINISLEYSTTYYWRVVEIGDTCDKTGALWSFTTEPDPNIVIVTIDVFPQNSDYWTGTCNSTTKTQTSLVNAAGNNAGWMAFDLSPIVNDPTLQILEVVFYGYLYNNAWPYWSITPMGSVNPVTGTASAIYSQVSNNYQEGVAYSYNQESGTLPNNAWLIRPLGNNVNTDLKNAVTQGWFAIGIVDWDFSSSWYVYFQGWAEANKPYLKVTYSYSVPVELTSFSAVVRENDIILNWATASETNNQGFEVQRKAAGGSFEAIGYLIGAGTTTEVKSYSYTDSKVPAGNYTYRLKQIDFDGSFEFSQEIEVDVTAPVVYALEQNYPNPFNPSTLIKYSIPEEGMVSLHVYNLLGEKVATLVNEIQKAGRHEINFDASQLSSGVYFYSIEAGNFKSIKKMLLMK